MWLAAQKPKKDNNITSVALTAPPFKFEGFNVHRILLGQLLLTHEPRNTADTSTRSLLCLARQLMLVCVVRGHISFYYNQSISCSEALATLPLTYYLDDQPPVHN